MANRLLLALLALIAGFATQAAPAPARMGASAMAPLDCAASALAVSAGSPLSCPAHPDAGVAEQPAKAHIAPDYPRVITFAVLTGVDRARE